MNDELANRLLRLRTEMERDPSSILAGSMEPPAQIEDPELAERWPQYLEFLRQCNGADFGGFTLHAYEQRNSNPMREDVFGDSQNWLDIGHWLYDMLGLEARTNRVVRFVTSAEYYEPGHDEELGTFDDLLLKITGPGYGELLSSYRPPEKLAKDPFWLFLEQAGLR